MKFIYFIKTRAVYIVLVLMSIICAGALIVAGKMTIIAYNKQEQEIGSQKIVNVATEVHTKAKLPSLKNITEYQLYFNGRRVEGLKAFTTTKGELLFPIDDICNYLGVKYVYHPTDEIFESDINNTKLVLRVGMDVCTVNGVELQLPYAVILSNDRIMVPIEVLNSLNGFSATGKAYNSAAYVNFTKDYNNPVYKKILYEAGSTLGEGIYNLIGKQYFSVNNADNSSAFSYSDARKSILYVNNGKASLLSNTMNFKPYKLDMGDFSQWSEDMKTIYEPLNDFNTLKIYNLDNGKYSTYENVRNIITATKDFEGFSNGVLRLVSYWNYSKITRINVLNTQDNKICTVLYKDKNPILIAKTWLSPSGRYMAYLRDGEYRLCAFDGEQDISLGNPVAIRWVTDNEIMLLKDGAWKLYDTEGKVISQDISELKSLGVINNWTVLYSDGKSIYRSENGIDTKVVDIEAKLDDIVASNNLNTIIASDNESNSVYLITEGISKKISETKTLLKTINENGIIDDLRRSVKISPDGNSFCIAQIEKDSVLVKIIGVDGSWVKEVRVDSDAYFMTQYGVADIEYIDNNNIIFKDMNSIWSINLKNDNPEIFRVFTGNEKINGVIVNK